MHLWHTKKAEAEKSPRSGNQFGFPALKFYKRKELIPMIDNPMEAVVETTAHETDPVTDETPTLILGKFKDYTELEKAYRESERYISQTREELKEARNLLKEAAIPNEITAFQTDLDAFLEENALTHRAYDFISYLTENPELLSLEPQDAFHFTKRALTTTPAPYRAYVDSLSQTPPAMICGQGGEFFATPGAKPKTFEEAGDLFLQMVKQ